MLTDIFLQIKSFFMQHPVTIGFAIVLFLSREMLFSFINIFISQTLSSKPRATGIAKDYVAHHKDIGFYSPVVTFETNGKEYTFTDKGRYGFIDNIKNKKFIVLYNPKNPQEAEVKQPLFAYNFFITILLLIIVYSFAIFFDPETQKSFTDILYTFIPKKNNSDIVILTAAFYFASFGAFIFWSFNHKRKGKVKIMGTIDSVQKSGKDRKGKNLYNYTVKYVYNGQTYDTSHAPNLFTTTLIRPVGSTEDLLINPENPYDVIGDPGLLGYIFPAFFIIFPTILLLIHYLSENGFN